MAEYMMPPEIEGFMEACGDVAMDNFDPAAFAEILQQPLLTQWVLLWTLWVNLECLLI